MCIEEGKVQLPIAPLHDKTSNDAIWNFYTIDAEIWSLVNNDYGKN